MKIPVRLQTLVSIVALCSACASPEPESRADRGHSDLKLGTGAVQEQSTATAASSDPYFRQVSTIPQLIQCGASEHTLCLADTTRAPDECCTGDAVADWILVMDQSDSLEFFVGPGSGVRRPDASITMQQIGGQRHFQEHDLNTASYLRYRFPEVGAYTLSVGVPMGASDTVAYELRIRQMPSAFATNPLRGAPLVFLEADSAARLAVLPNRPSGANAAALSAFRVRAGWYRVLAPGLDSVFACRLPCTTVQSLPLAARAWHATL